MVTIALFFVIAIPIGLYAAAKVTRAGYEPYLED